MRTQKEINLFNQLFPYYGNEKDTWTAVKIAVESNLTAEEVKKYY